MEISNRQKDRSLSDNQENKVTVFLCYYDLILREGGRIAGDTPNIRQKKIRIEIENLHYRTNLLLIYP